MNILISDRCKVWEIEDKDGYAEVKFNVSHKLKDTDYDRFQEEKGVAKNGYITESFSFVKFRGHAYNKLKEINIGDIIVNLKGDLDNRPYYDSTNDCKAYPKTPKMTIFSFELPNFENQKNSTNLDKAPQVFEDKEENIEKAPVVENSKASEECPF